MKRTTSKYVRIYAWEMNTPAWRSLSTDARSLLIELRALYSGRENRVYLSVRDMMSKLNIGQRRASRARDELIARGFIKLLHRGDFKRKQRHASEFALLNDPVEGDAQITPPLDYMKWGREKKSSVAMATTDSSCSDYRSREEGGKKPGHGSRNDYRGATNALNVGSRSDYTVSLPPTPGEKSGPAGWALHGARWRCRSGLVLDTQCPICRVWTTAKSEEFDGRRHRCDPVSRANWAAGTSSEVRP